MSIRLGVDVGGTFTDFLVKNSDGETRIYKSSTTPRDPTIGFFNGLGKAAAEAGQTLDDWLADVETIVHGTTITTNAVLTGEGAKAGFITTAGFRDVLNMRRGLKEDQFRFYAPPPQLVHRADIQVVREGVRSTGEIETELDEADVRRAAAYFKENGTEAIAVSYLWSFRNPEHERRTREILQTELPGIYVSISTEILPQIRAYERHSTTVLNSYVGPILSRYIERLVAQLRERRFRGTLLIMQSNGGVMSPDVAQRFASNTLLSGPAGGPQAGIFYGQIDDFRNLITVDMGGTSFDVSLLRNGVPSMTMESSIGGYRIASPTVEIHTIGSGGGSIARVDGGGLLQVGPKSAGAEPGPVCYGRGGVEPTVTDANCILGYLASAGDELSLDIEAARAAVASQIAGPLDMGVEQAAHGIYQVVSADMAAAISVVSVQRGYDPREFVLVIAGGAGPLHAAQIARELDIPLIQIPRQSSVFCAAGMLISDLKHDYVHTYAKDFDQIDVEEIRAILTQKKTEALATLATEHVQEDAVLIEYSVDVRYIGQFNEVTVRAFAGEEVSPSAVEKLAEDFHNRHDELYGYSTPNAPLELINLRVSARGLTDKPRALSYERKGSNPSAAQKGSRAVWLSDAFVSIPIFDGLQLYYGNVVTGPAIVEQPTTTILVPEDFQLTCDAGNNYLMYKKGRDLEALISQLSGEKL